MSAKTINEHIADLTSKFQKLSNSRKSALRRKALRYVRNNPHMANSNGFWRKLSANQVIAAATK